MSSSLCLGRTGKCNQQKETEKAEPTVFIAIRRAEYGAGDRIRTGDIDLGKVALYQLSYSAQRKTLFLRGNITDVRHYGKVIQTKTICRLAAKLIQQYILLLG